MPLILSRKEEKREERKCSIFNHLSMIKLEEIYLSKNYFLFSRKKTGEGSTNSREKNIILRHSLEPLHPGNISY